MYKCSRWLRKWSYLFLSCLLLSNYVNAQTQFWSDNFEDAGAPSSGTRVPSVENFQPASAPYTKYFARVIPTDLNLQNGSYSNYENSKIWAAEDIDAAFNVDIFGQSSHQSFSWNNINISGK